MDLCGVDGSEEGEKGTDARREQGGEWVTGMFGAARWRDDRRKEKQVREGAQVRERWTKRGATGNLDQCTGGREEREREREREREFRSCSRVLVVC